MEINTSHLLKKIVDLLAVYAQDAISVPESEICLFAREHNIPLREDHVRFLMRFGTRPGERLRIFHDYGGDFDFEYFKSVYVDDEYDMRVPEGNAYFGSTLGSGALCVDFESGKIYVYDTGVRYGLVHESIDGFLLRCLMFTYAKEAFSEKVIDCDVEDGFLNKFRMFNERTKIYKENAYKISHADHEVPVAVAEYYWVNNKLVKLYPTGQGRHGMVEYGGGILDNISF